eukprot:TRINITY_DN4749_c1_g1_i1.p1 TRINITY_DN4749_c1_g1~~TRINITY_DN4749_c1_g1_i1.p1  ORF type:complete len:435 (-),score=107.62 TRINITY_DN4749_c1_g1_i1:37-1341(-)
MGDSSSTIGGHFIDVQKSLKFGIRNKYGANVGVLTGDGMEINLDNPITGTFTLCLALRDLGSSTDGFPFWDFASSDSSFTTLLPLNLEVTINSTSDVLCANIKSNQLEQNYFPIKRLANWENVLQIDIAKTEFALSIALAVLFGLVALGSLFGLVVAIIYLMRKKRSIALTDVILVVLFVFSSIRMAYFSIPNRSPVVDFVLAALPTFLYFTAFSLIISFWAVTSQKFFAVDPKKMVKYGAIFVVLSNFVLYLVLIIIGALWHTFNNNTGTACGRRSDSEIREKATKMEHLSISYTVIVAFVSLLLAILFAYFGSKLVGKMKLRGGGTKKVVLTIAAVFSVTFALHSVFIVVVAILSKNPSSIFSFIGLIITEVIPPFYFIVMSTRYFSQSKPSSNSSHSYSQSTNQIRLSVVPNSDRSPRISEVLEEENSSQS